MKMNREKVQKFLTNCEYSQDVLGLYQTGQVIARTPAPTQHATCKNCQMVVLLKLGSTVISFPFFITERPELALTK